MNIPFSRVRPSAAGFVSWICVASVLTGYGDAAQKADVETATLAPGRMLARDVREATTHRYDLDVQANAFAQIRIESPEIDLSLTLTDPHGHTVAARSGPEGSTTDPPTVSFIATSSGTHRLVIVTNDVVRPGRYTIRFQELRAATSADRQQASAERVFEAGDALMRPATAAQAIDRYRDSLGVWESLGLVEWQAHTLMRLTQATLLRDDTDAALGWTRRAIPLWERLKEDRHASIAHNAVAEVSLRRGDAAAALDAAMRALHLVTGTDALRQEASALSNVSSAYWMLGDRSSEMAYLTRAIDAQRRTGDEASLALQLHNAGTSLQTVGEYQKALVNLREALAIRTRLKNVRGQASTMNGIGEVYRDLGRLQEALDYHTRAAALRRTTEDREGLGQSLNNVGLTYRGLGDFAKARACYEEALQLRRATKNRRAEAIVLLNLGVLEYADVKNLPAGLAYLREAQAINEALNNVPNLANVLRHTGRIEQLRGEYAAAESLFLRSLELARQVRTWPVQVDVLEQLASIAAARGDLDRARAHLEAAIGVIESERRLLFGDSFRAAFLAANPRIYPAYVETLMQLHGRDPAGGYDARALQAAEQFRARSLLDLLGEANVDLGRDVDPALVTRAAALQADIDKASRRVDQLRAAKQDESRRAETELTARVAEYQELRAQIRADHPHVAALAEPRPLSVADIQREVVDPESVLLEYSLGAERSYLWVVTPSEIRSFVLPPRAAIDPVARRIHDLLTVRNHRDPVETIGTWRRRLQDAERELDGALRSLSRMLIEPAASLLSNKRLLIVAGESLQYVPFAALPAPGGATPLIVSHEVVTLPSASTLAALRRDRAGRASPPGRVAILADPVFDGADPRLASRRRTPANAGGSSGAGVADSSRSEWRRVAQDVRAVGEDGRLPRLRYSRDEARAISALVPPANRLLALDFSATRALVESARLRQYRIVHIAAHGFVDSRRPELSGLALSMVDEKGQPVDGFLRLHHIYELKLPADLVVLSACQTAVGADIRGEGVISLTRGFMYAGASAVAATLWKVDDRATAELMTMFYREMLGPSRRSPAAALRAAQVAMRARPRWRSPYYWAAIMLQGEWR